MDEQEMNGMEEDDVIVFEDEEGNEYSYQIQDYMFYNGEEYALLAEENAEPDENGGMEAVICKIVTEKDENGEEIESFELVEDDDLAEKLVEIFNTKMAEDEEEE